MNRIKNKMNKWVYAILFVLIWSSLGTSAFAQEATTLNAESLTTYTNWGTIGDGQTESNLHMLDQTAGDNDWDKYVEFIPTATRGRYAGYRSYYLLDGVDRGNLGTLQVDINYRGPAKNTQQWKWLIRNWTTGGWSYLGDNTNATSWGDWETFTFIPNGEPADYVHPTTREIQVRHQSNNMADNMTLDYEAVSVRQPDSTQLLSPHSILTHSHSVWGGTTGDGQVVGNLHVQDQSGDDNDWDNYIEFMSDTARYSGFRRYYLPTDVDKNDLVSLKLHLNYRGPSTSTQVWTWQLYKWRTDTSPARWVTIGNNAGVPSWEWTSMTFNADRALGEYTFADFVHPTNNRSIFVRLVSNNTADNMTLDYEALEFGIADGDDVVNDWWQPTAGLSWWWQLENLDNLDTALPVDVYNIDLFDGISSGKLAELKGNGYRVICYISGGTYEPFRDDFPDGFGDDGSPYIGARMGEGTPDDPYDDWDEWWLNITPGPHLELIEDIMLDRLDLAKLKGCDGMEFDNVDSYSEYNYNGLGITYQNQLDWNQFLAEEAHARNLGAGLKNDLGQIPDLVSYFDFAVNEQCFQYNECNAYAPFIDAGKPVFAQEYGEGTDVSEAVFESDACTAFDALGIDALWKYSYSLDGNGVTRCD